MSLSHKVVGHARRNVIAYVALVMACGGTAYASLQVYSADIVDGQVKTVDLANDAVISSKVKNNNLTGDDVKDGSLGGVDVKDDGVTGADIQEGTLSVARMGCQAGKVRGFARVHGKVPIGAVWTSSPEAVDLVNNCAGGKVEVKQVAPAVYYVRFSGLIAALAVATPNTDGMPPNSSGADNIISIGKASSAPNETVFRVEVRDVNPGAPDGSIAQVGDFTIVVP